ncbi:MAG: GTP-binding protein [Myxococcales bacterium]|nr:GTP-binding protein [Myxococcales bacterium]
MIQKKVCMLGAFAVGKTSLVRRFVHSMFADKYLTTVGVKIDKKQLTHSGKEVLLLLWDLYGEDEFQRVQTTYLRGSSGLFLVADGTRPDTVEKAIELRDKALASLGNVPHVLLMNKCDLSPQWEVRPERLRQLTESGWQIQRTSAKTGEGVEQAFASLTEQMLGGIPK